MSNDTDLPDGVIGAIYEGAYDPFSWGEALALVRSAVSADFVCLAYIEFFDFLGSAWHSGVDDSFFQGFAKHFSQRDNVFIQDYLSRKPGAIVKRQDVLDDDAWRQSKIYCELFEPAGMDENIGACLVKNVDSFALIRFVRATSAGPFTEHDVAAFSELMPHLKRAMQIHGRIHGLQRDRATVARAVDQLAVGIVILSHRGEVLWINETAKALLSRRDGLILQGDQLAGIRPKDTKGLAALIRSAADPTEGTSGAIAIEKASSPASYAALVEPLFESTEKHGPLVRGAAVAFLLDPEAKPGGMRDVFRALYDLTDAEASVAAEVATGRSRNEIAERLGISVHTVRFHLTHIFSKTGTTRQAELTGLLLRSGPGRWSS